MRNNGSSEMAPPAPEDVRAARKDGGAAFVTIVPEGVARQLVTMTDAFVDATAAFRALDRQQASIFPPLLCRGFDSSRRFGAKAGTDLSTGLMGMKIGCYWPNDLGLSSHGSTTILIDERTGRPSAFVGATYLTALRTAAADAVAVSCLAREDSRTLGLVGAGHQAFYDLQAICAVRKIEEVLVWDRSPARSDGFVEKARQEGMAVRASSLEEVVSLADILVTVTAASEPLVRRQWVKPGTHISAMGADGPGKQELDVDLIEIASLFADAPEQAVRFGEFQHGYKAGSVSPDDIRPLGGVLEKRIVGRQSSLDITIFDSSGVAAQDLGLAALALTRAKSAGLAHEVLLHE